jgi:hypothetical protein
LKAALKAGLWGSSDDSKAEQMVVVRAGQLVVLWGAPRVAGMAARKVALLAAAKADRWAGCSAALMAVPLVVWKVV